MASYRSFSAVQADLKSGIITCRQLVEHYLVRIDEHHHLNVFTEVYADEARQQADHVDQKLAAGTAGRLAGMVIGLKDVLSYAGHGVRAGSRILDKFTAQFTATAVQRLIDEDVIIIGRQNCDEFAMGSSNENSSFGPVRNAADPTRVPGGSSGGSAVAVQADMCLASVGSDTGGSVRQPASFTGVLGFKPTYGALSRYGVIAFASSLDQVGVLARETGDLELALTAMLGHDPLDATSLLEAPRLGPIAEGDLSGLRIGRVKELCGEGNSAGVLDALGHTERRLRELGAEVGEVSLPHAPYGTAVYYIVAPAEASSNLARFDGMVYSHRSGANRLGQAEVMMRSRGESFGPEVRRRILSGTYALSAGYYDAYYGKALKVRRLIAEDMARAFERYDLLLTPTAPSVAFGLGENLADPLSMYLLDIDTVLANLAGVPALSVPAGMAEAGLPCGMQLLAPALGDARLLRVAGALERALGEAFAPLAK